ncbi:hypothetical protein [Micromonospora sp. WMMD1274]|uniref:hypothetical protein n=1 Tax=Micromonospora sp. WMMD1274 TaxID=3404116 RepID=UPI003B95B944
MVWRDVSGELRKASRPGWFGLAMASGIILTVCLDGHFGLSVLLVVVLLCPFLMLSVFTG